MVEIGIGNTESIYIEFLWLEFRMLGNFESETLKGQITKLSSMVLASKNSVNVYLVSW